MAKSKTHRSLSLVGESQRVTEESHSSKFASAKKTIDESRATEKAVEPLSKTAGVKGPKKRKSPLLSCTVDPHDKELLKEISLYSTAKEKRLISVSEVVRACVKMASKNKDDLEY